MAINVANPSAQLDGKTIVTVEADEGVTGIKTFQRSPDAPFEVEAGSAVVANLDADLLDGEEGEDFHNATKLASGTIPAARFPATLPAASGENLTNLDASQVTGTIPDSAVPAVLPAVSGANLTALPNPLPAVSGANLTALPATLPAASGVNLTALNASNLGSGTIPDGRFPATLPAASGVNLTSLTLRKQDAGSGANTTNVDAGETDLFTAAMPAFSDGDKVLVRFRALLAANTNTKTLKLYAGTNYVTLLSNADNVASHFVVVDVLLTRTSATAGGVDGILTRGAAAGATVVSIGALLGSGSTDFTAAWTLKITGQGGASSDVTLIRPMVSVYRLP